MASVSLRTAGHPEPLGHGCGPCPVLGVVRGRGRAGGVGRLTACVAFCRASRAIGPVMWVLPGTGCCTGAGPGAESRGPRAGGRGPGAEGRGPWAVHPGPLGWGCGPCPGGARGRWRWCVALPTALSARKTFESVMDGGGPGGAEVQAKRQAKPSQAPSQAKRQV